MGTTLTALTDDDGVSYQWVLAIDGFEYLLTDGSTSAAVTAWASTPWASALGGLFVDGQFEQTLDPWDPIKGAGDVTFIVRDCDGNETLAKRVFKRSGTETLITQTVDNNDTTINVQSTSGLTGADVYIGIERVGFSGSTGTTFTGADRGKYSPFNRSGATDHEFGRYHKINDASLSPNAKPIVSDVCRVWSGKWVGLWLHRKVAGVLDTKAQAQLIFAGKIAEVRENENGDVVIAASHVIDAVAECTVLDSQFRIQFAEGIYLAEDDNVGMGSYVAQIVTYNGTTAKTVNIQCVSSGATGYQINAGTYTATQIVQHIAKVCDAAMTATDINVQCFFELVDSGGPRCQWRAKFSTGNGTHATLNLQHRLAVFLGMAEAQSTQRISPTAVGVTIEVRLPWVSFQCVRREGEDSATILASSAPYRVFVFSQPKRDANEKWLFYPNYYFVPIAGDEGSFIAAADNYFAQFGTLLLSDGTEDTGNRFLLTVQGHTFLATWTTYNNAPSELHIYAAHATIPAVGDKPYLAIGVRMGDEGELYGTQTVVLTGDLATTYASLLASTPTQGYNHATYDKGLAGAGIPWELLGTTFVESLQKIDVLTESKPTLILDKPTRLKELISVDLILRRMFLVWRNGGLRFVQWNQPIDADNLPALTESNKASSDPNDRQVTAVSLSEQWVRNVVKVEYDRELSTENYYRTITIEDAASITDLGRQLPITLKARNAFSLASNGANVQRIERLMPEFAAWVPLVSRPMTLLRRTIDFSLFEDFGVGSIVSVTDNHVRDPQTGERGISNLIGIVVGHRYSYGGADPSNWESPRPIFGEVDVVIMGTEKVGDYCPAAEVDDTADAGGFTDGWNSGTSTLRTIAQKYQTAATYDASYFQADDEIQVIEIDPDVGATVTPQNATVVSVSTTDIVLDTSVTLAAGKKYRVIPRKYADCTSAQRSNRAYVSDDTDGKVQDLREGLQFAEAENVNTPATAALSTAAVLVHDAYSDEGMPVDVGADHAACETLNNLLSYRQLLTRPLPLRTAEVGGMASNAILLFPFPVPFLRQNPDATEFFRLRFAPTFRSSTGGTATVIVTISQFPPRSRSDGTSIASEPTWYDKFYQKTWTTTSTTVAEASAEIIDLADVCAPQYPFAWCTVQMFGSATEFHGMTDFSILPWEP